MAGASAVGASLALLLFVLVEDLLRWQRGATHFPVLAQLLLLLAGATLVAGIAATGVRWLRRG